MQKVTSNEGSEEKQKHTGGLLAETLGDLALLLEVEVPALGLAGGVLEGEGEDGAALLDGVLAVGVRGESLVDLVKGGGGGELGCCGSLLALLFVCSSRIGVSIFGLG